MNLAELLDRITNQASTDLVFAPAHTTDTHTVIPAARVRNAFAVGARGEVTDNEGGSFAVTARPAGALVIDRDTVRWKTPFDLNRVILGGQLVGIAYFLSAWLIERSRANAALKVGRAAAGK